MESYEYKEMRKHPLYERHFYYRTLTFDLSIARNDEEISLPGNVLAVLNSSSDGITFEIKFWREVSERLTLEKGSHLSFPFKRFFLTNTAQADLTLYLLVVKGMSWSELTAAGGLGFDITPDIQNVNVVGGADVLQYEVVLDGIVIAERSNIHCYDLVNTYKSGSIFLFDHSAAVGQYVGYSLQECRKTLGVGEMYLYEPWGAGNLGWGETAAAIKQQGVCIPVFTPFNSLCWKCVTAGNDVTYSLHIVGLAI